MNMVRQMKIMTDCGKWELFEKLTDSYAKYYSLTEHLAVDEIIVLFKGRFIVKQNIPKKHRQFGIKLYKFCDSKLHTYNMTMYAGKDRNRVTHSMTAIHVTVTELIAKIENVGHTLYMDNFFSFPLDNLHTKTINCHWGLLVQIEKGCQRILDIKWKWRGVTKTKVRSNLTASVEGHTNVNILTNMHSPPLEGNFCNEQGKAVNLAI